MRKTVSLPFTPQELLAQQCRTEYANRSPEWRTPALRFQAAMRQFQAEVSACFADAEAFEGCEADEGMTLGELIRTHRQTLGLSLQDVADRSGFTKSHIWELEDGRSANPTVRAVQSIASALGLPSTLVFRAALRAQS